MLSGVTPEHVVFGVCAVAVVLEIGLAWRVLLK